MRRASGLCALALALGLAPAHARAQADPPGPQRLIPTPHPEILGGGAREPPQHFVRPHGQRLLPLPYPQALGDNALDDPAILSPRGRRQRLIPQPYPLWRRALVPPRGGVTILAQAGEGAPSARLARIADIGPYLARCWRADAAADAGSEATLRFALRRDGSLIAPPRVIRAVGPTPAARDTAAREAERAVARCAPLPLDPALGAAIAGRPLTVRFRDDR
ncbi:MAG: hypothetical protein IPL88_12030 [Rhizobiales bacterium]|nr:hypothetical protein [Hyphomicrobiales bacterium]